MGDDTKKKKSPIVRIILLLILLGAVAGGAWFMNDSAAVDSANAQIKELNAVSAGLQDLMGQEKMEDAAIRELYDRSVKITDSKGGGQGFLPFLTRQAVTGSASNTWYRASALRVVLAAMLGDRKLIDDSLAAYDDAEKVAATDGKERKEQRLVAAVRKLMEAAGDDLNVDALRSGIATAFRGY